MKSRQSQPYKRLKQEPVRITSSDAVPTLRNQPQVQVKSETPTTTKKVAVRDGSKYPEFRTSTIDVDGVPVWEPSGKPITEVDLDADIAQETKPWRVPGTDPTGIYTLLQHSFSDGSQLWTVRNDYRCNS